MARKDVDGRDKPGQDEAIAWQNPNPCANRWRTLQWRKGAITMTSRLEFRRSTVLATRLALLAAIALTVSGTSPARADRCDDLAGQLKGQIDGLAVGKTAANVIYLSHPQAKQITLGCAGRNYSNQLYAKSDSRRPKPAFVDVVASAAAIIFTLPKDDMRNGATRCIKRMGLFRGDDVKTRYRRLDMRCSRTKTEASITISRGTDE
jgi:hypothetical protein